MRTFAALDRLHRIARAFGRDCRGVSGIEFAIIVPILVLLFAATLDLGQALTVKRRLNQIATTSSDVIAQEAIWTGSQLDNMLAGAAKILEPYDPSSLQIRAMLLKPQASGVATTVWTRNYPSSNPMTLPVATIDPKIVETGVDVVTLTVSYKMQTAFTALLSAATGVQSYNLSSVSLSRPRVADTVDLTQQ